MKRPHPAEAAPALELRGHIIREIYKHRECTAYLIRRDPDNPTDEALPVTVVIHAPTVTLDPDDFVRLTVHTTDRKPNPRSVYHHFPSDTRHTSRSPRSAHQ